MSQTILHRVEENGDKNQSKKRKQTKKRKQSKKGRQSKKGEETNFISRIKN